MKLTPDEIYVIKRSIEARIEWAETESEISDEESHLASALDKLNKLSFELIKTEEGTIVAKSFEEKEQRLANEIIKGVSKMSKVIK